MQTVRLAITGMTCQGCVRSVQRVLEQVDGVTAVEVALEDAEARVTFDPLCASIEQLRGAVVRAGYETR
jgi:copper chaperone